MPKGTKAERLAQHSANIAAFAAELGLDIEPPIARYREKPKARRGQGCTGSPVHMFKRLLRVALLSGGGGGLGHAIKI